MTKSARYATKKRGKRSKPGWIHLFLLLMAAGFVTVIGFWTFSPYSLANKLREANHRLERRLQRKQRENRQIEMRLAQPRNSEIQMELQARKEGNLGPHEAPLIMGR
ncbi:MAG: phage holin family protein [Armatimonadetes bacterium]|nr:phage holin family protein [Armatimonadota bacterium]